MDNNQGVVDFINKYPDEFDKLVYILKNLKFDSSDSTNTTEETKELNNAIETLKKEYGLDNFVNELLSKVDLKRLLIMLKDKVKMLKQNNKTMVEDKAKNELNLLNDIDNEFEDLEKSTKLISKLSPLSSVTETIGIDKNKNLSKLKNVTRKKNNGISMD